jgi:hypothetical protein
VERGDVAVALRVEDGDASIAIGVEVAVVEDRGREMKRCCR